MCTIAAALQGASAVAGYVGQVQQTNAYNQQAATNAFYARLGASNKYDASQKRYAFDAKATNREGFQAVMQGREAIARGKAASGDAGISGGSISLANLIAGQRQKIAENVARIDDKQYNLWDTYRSNTEAAKLEAEGRIASMPYRESPSPLGLAINLAGVGMKAGQDSGWWDAGFKEET